MQLQEATAPDAVLVPVVRESDGKVLATIYARIGEYKVRATVQRDSSPQGNKFGGVSVWDKDGLTWQRIHGLNDGLVMPLQSGPAVRGALPVDASMFAEDMAELMAAARDILL